MKKLVLILLLFTAKAFAITVHLNNDSSYALEATIQNARGDVLQVMTLPASALVDWSDTYGEQGYSGPFPPPPDQHVYSSAPFRVTWRCPSGDIYSICSNLAPGAMAQASQGTGSLNCKKSSSATSSKGSPAS